VQIPTTGNEDDFASEIWNIVEFRMLHGDGAQRLFCMVNVEKVMERGYRETKEDRQRASIYQYMQGSSDCRFEGWLIRLSIGTIDQ
jgi:hypothetical protein